MLDLDRLLIRILRLATVIWALQVPDASSARADEPPPPRPPSSRVGAVEVAGVDASAADVTPRLAGALPRTLAAHMADVANVRDFGALGDVVSRPIVADVSSGSRLLTFPAPLPVHAGERVTGPNLPPGTTVVASTGVSVTLSIGLAAADAAGTLIDFCPHDDAPAFVAAQAALPDGGVVSVPSGRYYLGAPVPEVAGITYRLDGATVAHGSAGVPNFTDQSQVQGLVADALSRQFASSMQENLQFLSAHAVPTRSHVSYQKNVQSIRLTDADPYARWTDSGGAHVATHDLVGQFIIAEMPASNRDGGLWDTNWVLGIDPGSRGGAILQEAQIINGRASAVSELDDLDPVSGYDWIFDGAARDTYGLLLQGRTSRGGPGLESGILFRRGAIRAAILANRTAAYADPDGHVSRHLDNFHVMADGSLFAQALHVGGGDSTGSVAGETLPTTGLSVGTDGAVTAPDVTAHTLNAVGFSVTGNANGAVALGSGTIALTPLVDFESGRASSCRVSGNVGSNLDFACLDPADGRLVTDLILYPAGAAFQVPARFPSIEVGRLVAGAVTATGSLQARGGIVAAETSERGLRPADCGTTLRDTGASAHAYEVPIGLPIGCRIDVLQEGRGRVTVAPEAGETMEAFGPASVTAGLHAHLQIIVDTDRTFNVHP